MSMFLFHNDWYHGIIESTCSKFDEGTSADAAAISKGVMIAGCCIAQAIDKAFGDVRGDTSIRKAVEELAGYVQDVSEAIDKAAG